MLNTQQWFLQKNIDIFLHLIKLNILIKMQKNQFYSFLKNILTKLTIK